MKRVIVHPGDLFGCIRVNSQVERANTRLKYWRCECQKCGHVFTINSQNIFKYAKRGSCPECRKQEKAQNLLNEYKGKRFGDLTIIGYAGSKLRNKNGARALYMICKCGKCGSVTEIPLSRLKEGGATACVNCSRKNLDAGRELVKNTSIGGTNVLSIKARYNVNKNSTTGIRGVSQMKDGKYRAYINFRRKQYHLGCYTRLEDAKIARQDAEQKIYGDFLNWYAESFPEQWEQINKSVDKNKTPEL